MMRALRHLAAPLAALLLFLAAGGSGLAAAPASTVAPAISPGQAGVLSRAEAQSALQTLEDPAKRAALISVLKLLAAGQAPPPAEPAQSPASVQAADAGDQIQAAGNPAAVPARTTPAPAASTTAQAASTTAKPAAVHLSSDSLGALLLIQAQHSTTELINQTSNAVHAVNDFPLLWRWMRRVATTSEDRVALLDAGWKLAVVLLAGFALEWVAVRLLRRGLVALESMAPDRDPDPIPRSERDEEPAQPKRPNAAWRMLQRLPYVLGRFLLELLPLGAFAATAAILLGSGLVESDTTRLVIVYVAYGYLVCRIVIATTRAVFAPARPRLRLLRVTDRAAAYTVVWVRRLAVVAVAGYVFGDIGLLFGLYQTAHDALLKFFALIDHVFAVIIVLQCRQAIAAHIRPPKARRGVVATFLRRLADVWHLIAIFYIMALWLVWAAEVQDGYARLFRFFVVTSLIIAGGRLLGIIVLGALERSLHRDSDRASGHRGLEARASRYFPLLRSAVSALIFVVTIVSLLQAWGLGGWSWFLTNSLGTRLVDALVTVGIAVVLAILAWEGMNATMERQLSRLTDEQQMVKAARLRTLMPILRTALLITILLVVGLTALSEIGVNIAPLLAGAGILGVAIGFGSQKLVQDFITGIFLLIENTMQVGDWVTVAGLSGSVENLSIRTLRLRAGDGSIHIIPFSSVSSVTNTNRGIGNAAVSVEIAAHEDTDAIGDLLKDVAREMRGEMPYKLMMKSDLQLWGVDKVTGESVTIVGQIVCTDAGRWGVQREFNRRMKKKFDERGIALAVPIQTVVMQRTREAAAPRALDATGDGDPGPTTATVKLSPPPQALGNMS